VLMIPVQIAMGAAISSKTPVHMLLGSGRNEQDAAGIFRPLLFHARAMLCRLRLVAVDDKQGWGLHEIAPGKRQGAMGDARH
jgi:hypothetical protein